MPQIDQLDAIFASQLFWLAVVFGIVLVGIGYGMLPKILGTVEQRDARIGDDLAAAERARVAADETEEAYRARINESRAEALKVTQAAKQESARETEQRIAEADAANREKLDAAAAITLGVLHHQIHLAAGYGGGLALSLALDLPPGPLIACVMAAIGERPPARTLVAVRAMAPVAAMPPKNGATKLPMPRAMSSASGSWRVRAMPSATTADSKDSIAPSIAMAIPAHCWRVGASRSQSAESAATTSGWTFTRTTDAAMVVSPIDVFHDQKCSARSTPAAPARANAFRSSVLHWRQAPLASSGMAIRIRENASRQTAIAIG